MDLSLIRCVERGRSNEGNREGQKSGARERNFKGTPETTGHFTCAQIHTHSCGGRGVGAFAVAPRASDVQTFPDI